MNNKVKFLRGTATEYEASTKDNDTFYYTTDDEKLYLGGTKITSIEVDDTSTTATDKTWSAKKINDSIPTELPANGGNADTVNTIAGDIGANTGNVYPVFVDSNNSTSTAETLKTSELLQFWGSKGGVSLLTIGGQKSSSGLLKLYNGTGDYFSALRAANNPSSDVSCYLPDESGTLALKADIPTKLPADGGNADTVDNKHASDFMQNLGTLTTGSLLDYVLTMTNSGYLLVNSNVTDTPISGQFFFVDVRRETGGSYAITATRFNAGGVYTNRYNAGMKKWSGWTNVADGGNADTVGNLSAIELVRNLGRVTDATFLNNSEFNEYSYEADIEPTAAAAIGLPAGWYIIKGFRYYGTGKYAVQIAYPRNSANQAMTRYANGTDWTEWRGLGDGCNAASVGGKTITVTDVDPGAGSALNTGALVFVTEVT